MGDWRLVQKWKKWIWFWCLDSLETLAKVADTDCYNTMGLVIRSRKGKLKKKQTNQNPCTIPKPSSLELRLGEGCEKLHYQISHLLTAFCFICHQRSYVHKIEKRAPKSETETFGIVGRFYRFEDWAPTNVQRLNVCTFLYSTYRKNLHLG